MPKIEPVHSYEVLKLVLFLESVTTWKLRYYYLHHDTPNKPSFETTYQGLKFPFAHLKSDTWHFQWCRTISLKRTNMI